MGLCSAGPQRHAHGALGCGRGDHRRDRGATVFSLLDRPVAQESLAARTLVAPNPIGPMTASTSVAAQQPTEPQQVKSPAEQKAPLAPAADAATHPQPIELATTSTPQGPTSTAALAEAPVVKDTISDQTSIATDPAPAQKP